MREHITVVIRLFYYNHFYIVLFLLYIYIALASLLAIIYYMACIFYLRIKMGKRKLTKKEREQNAPNILFIYLNYIVLQ